MQDITVLYSDPAKGVSLLWPGSNLSNRLESGGSKTLKFALLNERQDHPVYESLIVLSVPATSGSIRTVFSGLQSGEASRGAQGPMASYLSELVTGEERSRSFSLTPSSPSLSVARLNLIIAPKPEP